MLFLRYLKVVILGALGMPRHPHQKQRNQVARNFYVCLPEKKYMIFIPHSLIRYYNLNHLVVGVAKSLLAHNFTTRILRDKGFALMFLQNRIFLKILFS